MADSKPTKTAHITEMPITWRNWYQHVNWLSVFFIIVIPLMGFIAAYHYPLQRATAAFAIFYYFNTGLGITAGAYVKVLWATRNKTLTSLDRIPSPLGTFFIPSFNPSQNLSGGGRRWRRPGLDSVVVKGPSCPSPVY